MMNIGGRKMRDEYRDYDERRRMMEDDMYDDDYAYRRGERGGRYPMNYGEEYPGRRGVRGTGRYGNPRFRRYSQDDGAELSYREMKDWVNNMETTDSNGNIIKRGEKYSISQAIELVQRIGIKFDKFSEEEFWVAINAMYSDYYSVLGDNPEMYAKLAKAFLCDGDAVRDKLSAYYYAIVEPRM